MVKKTYNIDCDIRIRSHIHTGKNRTYIVEVKDDYAARKILSSVKLMHGSDKIESGYPFVSPLIFQKACCKRAFLRGVFLCTGSISEPEKTYHFEMVCATKERAEQLCDMMKTFNIDGKWITRKKYFVVYIKEASQIVDMLNVMEAGMAILFSYMVIMPAMGIAMGAWFMPAFLITIFGTIIVTVVRLIRNR